MSAPRSFANRERSRRVLYRRLVVFVSILVAAQLLIVWSWLFYSVLGTQTSESSLPHQTSSEEASPLDYGEAVYPREIDDPVVEKEVFALKNEPHPHFLGKPGRALSLQTTKVLERKSIYRTRVEATSPICQTNAQGSKGWVG